MSSDTSKSDVGTTKRKLGQIGRTLLLRHKVRTHDSEVLEERVDLEILLSPAERRELVTRSLEDFVEYVKHTHVNDFYDRDLPQLISQFVLDEGL